MTWGCDAKKKWDNVKFSTAHLMQLHRLNTRGPKLKCWSHDFHEKQLTFCSITMTKTHFVLYSHTIMS